MPKLIVENRKARFLYDVLDKIEAGIVLRGTEIKSIVRNSMSLDGAYVAVDDGEAVLVGSNIEPYQFGNVHNHEPRRQRKLLLKRSQITRLGVEARQHGITLIPLRAYFGERGKVKVEVGLCRGRKLHDKRQAIKERDARRDIATA